MTFTLVAVHTTVLSTHGFAVASLLYRLLEGLYLAGCSMVAFSSLFGWSNQIWQLYWVMLHGSQGHQSRVSSALSNKFLLVSNRAYHWVFEEGNFCSWRNRNEFVWWVTPGYVVFLDPRCYLKWFEGLLDLHIANRVWLLVQFSLLNSTINSTFIHRLMLHMRIWLSCSDDLVLLIHIDCNRLR